MQMETIEFYRASEPQELGELDGFFKNILGPVLTIAAPFAGPAAPLVAAAGVGISAKAQADQAAAIAQGATPSVAAQIAAQTAAEKESRKTQLVTMRQQAYLEAQKLDQIKRMMLYTGAGVTLAMLLRAYLRRRK